MINETAIEEFRDGLRSALIQPEDKEYEEACKVYNGMMSKHSLMIAKCVDVADVKRVVNFARNIRSHFPCRRAYVNFMMDEGEERVKATYGENYDRLVQIKNRYDPQNLFRVNQNIKPSVEPETQIEPEGEGAVVA